MSEVYNKPHDSKEKWEQMHDSLIVAFDWAFSLQEENQQAEVVSELCSYAAIEGDMSNELIDEILAEALKQEEQ